MMDVYKLKSTMIEYSCIIGKFLRSEGLEKEIENNKPPELCLSVAGAILMMARNEHPIMPLRVWLLGYALQYVLHMVCVLVEYRRRNRVRNNRTPRSRSSSSSSSMEEDALGSRRNSHEELFIHISFDDSIDRIVAKERPVHGFKGLMHLPTKKGVVFNSISKTRHGWRTMMS
ncbi:hypothetical protein Bca4012_049892 [Brassica carinata]